MTQFSLPPLSDSQLSAGLQAVAFPETALNSSTPFYYAASQNGVWDKTPDQSFWNVYCLDSLGRERLLRKNLKESAARTVLFILTNGETELIQGPKATGFWAAGGAAFQS